VIYWFLVNGFLRSKQFPNLIFYGPAGTGKTSLAGLIAASLFTAAEVRLSNVLELNASDERGIDIIREKILSFASILSISDFSMKLIILDEADSMTSHAQNALRRSILSSF
jgi:DNA polymerase III delta prime subunit